MDMKIKFNKLFTIKTIAIFLSAIISTISFADTNKLSDTVNGALLFDGTNDFINIPYNPAFNVQTFTVECWVKFRNIETSGEDDSWGNVEQVLFSKGIDNQTGTFHFFERHVNGKYHLGLEAGLYTSGDIVISDPLDLVNGQWYHAAGSYDGNTLKVYLNGKLVGSHTIGYFSFTNTGILSIGHHPHESGNLWQFYTNGYIQEVRLWSKARSADEIKETMYEYLDNANGLISSWHLDNADSQTIIDTTGGHNGYLGSTYGQDSNDPKWALSDIIIKKFGVIYPDGGEILKSSSPITIQWRSGDVEKINISYSTDNGFSWQTIVSGFDCKAEEYLWDTPKIESFGCLVKIIDSSDSTVSDISNAVFTISSPFLRFLSPSGGEIWCYGSQHNIKWESLDTDYIKLEYSTDLGLNWYLITASWDAGLGSYAWPVPFIGETDCIIRISDTANDSLSSVSAPFHIAGPNIRVTYPNGGETLDFLSATYITWTSDGIDFVDIELSLDGGLSWISLAQKIDAAKQQFLWNPSKAVTSKLCLIRISDFSKQADYDESDKTFTTEISQIITEVTEKSPRELKLFNNFPNPFNPSTTITFSIPEPENITIDIYNVSGQKIKSLINGSMSAGEHSVRWDAAGSPAGVYFYKIKAGKFERTMKMTLVK